MRNLASYFYFFASMFFLSNSVFAQTNTDSISYYYKKGDFKKAIILGEKLKTKSNKKDSEYALLANYLATAYSRIGEDEKAIQNYIEELNIEKNIFGENHIIIAKTYRNLGNTYSRIKEFDKAEAHFLKGINIVKNTSGTSNPEYPEYLFDLAILYKEIKDFKRAETLFLEACDLLKNNLGENNLKYQIGLLSTAIFYDQIGDLQKAEELFLKSYQLQKLNLKKETFFDFISIIDCIGKGYDNRQNHTEAQKFYLESLELKKNVLGTQSQEHINSLIDLGMSFDQQTDYPKSRIYYNEAIICLKNNKNENSDENAFVLHAIASGYSFEGKYNTSEKLYSQVSSIYEKLYGEKSYKYINSLKLLAGNYSNKGDYNNAEQYYLKTVSLSKSNGVSSYEYLDNMLSLIDFYSELKDTSKVSKYLFEAEQVYEKIKLDIKKDDLIHYELTRAYFTHYLDNNQYNEALKMALKKVDIIKNHKLFKDLSNGYSKDLSDLALVYKKLGDYENSEKFYNEAFEIKKNKIGENPRNDASLLMSRALVFEYKKDLISAEKDLKQALNIIETQLSDSIPFYDDLLYFIATLYFDNDKYSEVVPYLNKIFLKNISDLKQSISFLSATEFESIRKELDNKRNLPLSYLKTVQSRFPIINIGCYENELLIKNISLRNQQRIKNSIEKSNDVGLKEKYFQFTENKKRVGKLQELPKSKRPLSYDQLILETESLEKDLTRLSSSFADVKKSLSITWKQIQEKLKTDEVAIDLVTFNYYNKKWTDSIVYGAFVVKKDSKFPKYISLFEEKQLEFLLHKNKDVKESDLISKLYSTKSMSDLFLKPLESDLKGVKSIYLSPSGLGHQIDFNALQLTETKTFGDSYNIHILGSTSELVNYKVASFDKNKNIELLLYGGIDFDKSDSSVNNETPLTDSNEMATRSGISGWNYLEGTVNEINQIATKAKQNNFKAEIKTNREATEESVKRLDGKSTPYVLHLATHGFFFPDPKQEIVEDKWLLSNEMTKAKIYKTSEDPMMRSGLLLAGANKYWKKTAEEQNTDDGILTAKEISNLDLSACELVVMSACETGLGDIKGSEGVFGLQRAFKMAGVKNIIMSLWKVPDAQTSELFDIFYEECFSGKSIHDSFKTAQSKMKAKYLPYYWAGFVLLE